MSTTPTTDRYRPWLVPAAVFVAVAVVQLWLVAAAGTDIPFYDQWDVEGRWLYPRWLAGDFAAWDLLQPSNEHRIVWTYLWDLALFELNGQWDPLVQLCANTLLRSAVAALLVVAFARDADRSRRWVIGAGITFAFLPHLAWHTVLWGAESHAYFAAGFGILALLLLGEASRSPGRTAAGLLAGIAGIFAMGPAGLAPFALLGLAGVRAAGRRRWDGTAWREAWPGLLLAVLALVSRVPSPVDDLHAHSVGEMLAAAGRMLAWPHVANSWAAVVMNVPLAALVGRRIRGTIAVSRADEFALALGLWGAAVGLAAAWARGGGVELQVGVPSRYVDFAVLLPIANVWAAARFATGTLPTLRLVTAAWVVFVFVGWLGLSAEIMRRVVLPRARNRDAPVRLCRAFQQTGDAQVFAGQPRLLVPHPDLNSIRAVLADPRLDGRMPPSLQPERPLGPLSRAARWLLRR